MPRRHGMDLSTTARRAVEPVAAHQPQELYKTRRAKSVFSISSLVDLEDNEEAKESNNLEHEFTAVDCPFGECLLYIYFRFLSLYKLFIISFLNLRALYM